MTMNRKMQTVVHSNNDNTPKQFIEEPLIHVTPWLNLKTIMLSKRSLTGESTYGMIPIIGNSKRNKSNLWWEKTKQRFLLVTALGN